MYMVMQRNIVLKRRVSQKTRRKLRVNEKTRAELAPSLVRLCLCTLASFLATLASLATLKKKFLGQKLRLIEIFKMSYHTPL